MYIERFSRGRDSRIILSLLRVEVKAVGNVSVWIEKLFFARYFSTVVSWLVVVSVSSQWGGKRRDVVRILFL